MQYKDRETFIIASGFPVRLPIAVSAVLVYLVKACLGDSFDRVTNQGLYDSKIARQSCLLQNFLSS